MEQTTNEKPKPGRVVSLDEKKMVGSCISKKFLESKPFKTLRKLPYLGKKDSFSHTIYAYTLFLYTLSRFATLRAISSLFSLLNTPTQLLRWTGNRCLPWQSIPFPV